MPSLLRPAVLRRLFKEAWFPLTAGIAWGLTSWWLGKSGLDSFNAGGALAFFVLFFQGQLFRIAKNVRDEESTKEMQEGFKSLHDAIDQLRKQRVPDLSIPDNLPGRAPTYPDVKSSHRGENEPGIDRPEYENAKAFLLQANEALEKDLLYPAMISAAIGYEHAIRGAGEAVGLDIRKPTSFLIEELAKRLKSATLSRSMKFLYRARNQLVHGERSQNVSKSEAEELVGAFAQMTDYLMIAVTLHQENLSRN